MRSTRVVKALDAVTATTTSSNIYVGDARRVGVILTRADHSAGSTAYSFKGGASPDGGTTAPTMITINTFIDNVTNTNAQTITRVAGKTLSSNTSVLIWLNLDETPIEFLQVTATETTDGTHSAWFLIQY